jgi:hypothetical protein
MNSMPWLAETFAFGGLRIREANPLRAEAPPRFADANLRKRCLGQPPIPPSYQLHRQIAAQSNASLFRGISSPKAAELAGP